MNNIELQIISAPDHRLRLIASRVFAFDVDEQLLIDGMFVMMEKSNGIGLAAPQIGVSKRIIVMDVPKLEAHADIEPDAEKHGRFEMVNPTIISRDGSMTWNEGCLSVPGFDDDVKRDRTVSVKYQDRYGNEKLLHASGLLAGCIQHEIDHLDGVLFIDRLSTIRKDIIIRKLKKLKKEAQRTNEK